MVSVEGDQVVNYSSDTVAEEVIEGDRNILRTTIAAQVYVYLKNSEIEVSVVLVKEDDVLLVQEVPVGSDVVFEIDVILVEQELIQLRRVVHENLAKLGYIVNVLVVDIKDGEIKKVSKL